MELVDSGFKAIYVSQLIVPVQVIFSNFLFSSIEALPILFLLKYYLYCNAKDIYFCRLYEVNY